MCKLTCIKLRADKVFPSCRLQMSRQLVWSLLTVFLIYQVRSPKMCESHRGLKSKFLCRSVFALPYCTPSMMENPAIGSHYCSLTPSPLYIIIIASMPGWYGNYIGLYHIPIAFPYQIPVYLDDVVVGWNSAKYVGFQ